MRKIVLLVHICLLVVSFEKVKGLSLCSMSSVLPLYDWPDLILGFSKRAKKLFG